ncbi:MAG: SPOR domain-containing protein [Actinobacteria bacterium]|nr:SPOR domain-containing protein [Actinomycetota bacterium]
MGDAQHDDRFDGEGYGEQKYWFNSRTGKVEYGLLSSSLDRIGPFDTEAEAARALHILRERAKAWADEDAAEDSWSTDGAR